MEQFFTNIDLVSNICKFLNNEEQFKLSQVSSDLEYIIVNYVWNIKFHDIQIIITQMSFVVSDTLRPYNDFNFDYFERDIWRRNSIILTSKNLEIFLNLNASNIKKLHLITYKGECNSYESIKMALPFRKKFPNLTELSCWYIVYEMMDLQQVAVNCPKLETLVLNNCSDLKGRLLDITPGINIKNLKAMQYLNTLSICGCNPTFSHVTNIINQLKLQQLTLNGSISNDCVNTNNDLNLSNLKYYKELNMPGFCDDSDFLYFQTNFLPHMENLCSLSLSTDQFISINKEFFNILLKSCKSLTRLVLKGFGINDFTALPSLNELNLDYCELTYSHLKTALSNMNLKSFKSTSNYSGNFECFSISPSLQEIEISVFNNNDIALLEFNKKNLLNLTAFRYHGYEMLRVLNFARNLKVLNTQADLIIAKDCLNLKYLQEITLSFSIKMPDFLLLLKHENLLKLSVHNISYSCDQKSLVSNEMKTFHTNLRYLNMISWYYKESITDILLDLLNMNTKLSLACHVNEAMPITEILSHAKFPKRFKNINVCGVSIDCNSIRCRCWNTMSQIENLIKSINEVNSHPYIILR